MRLELDGALILSEAEYDELTALVPPGWSDPRVERLAREGTLDDPFDVYNLFDIGFREAVDDAAGEQGDHSLIDAALVRILERHPETLDDVLGPPQPSAHAAGEILLAHGDLRRCAARLAEAAGVEPGRAAEIAAGSESVKPDAGAAPEAETVLAELIEASHALREQGFSLIGELLERGGR